jgi:hypothetical protein
MTFGEAHERIDVIIDKHDLPWFEPEEKDIFLEFAQQEFVNTRYKEFEINEKRREDLRTLITTSTGTGASVSVPADMLFVLSLKGMFNIQDCGKTVNREYSIRPMQHDDINKILNDPFNKPLNSDPSYVTTANEFSIKSETAPNSWELVYLKSPDVVDGTNNPATSFVTPNYTHNEIVNIAVRKMLASIEQDTYQLQMNEIDNQE